MKLNLKSIIWVGLILSIAFWAWPQPVVGYQAQIRNIPSLVQDAPSPECWPLDIVILVDQSVSMFMYHTNDGVDQWVADPGTATVDQGPSDPNGYRYRAVEEVLRRLVANRQEECSQAVHRLAVLQWGSTVKEVLPLIEINLGSSQDPRQWLQPYLDQIYANSDDPTQTGTDPKQAFEAARILLDNAPELETPEGYGERRQAVIMVTDGYPTMNQGATVQKKKIPEYMQDVFYDFERNATSWQNYRVYVLALEASRQFLNEPGASGILANDFRTIATEHGGKLFDRAYTEQTIPAFLSDIVADLFGRPGQVITCGDVFYVDPYLQKIEFLFFRAQGENRPITLVKLDEATNEIVYEVTGSQETVNNPQRMGRMQFLSELYEDLEFQTKYIFDLPVPGAWRFDIQGLSSTECQALIEARAQPLNAQLILKTPSRGGVIPVNAAPPYYSEWSPKYEFALMTVDGDYVAQNPDYPLTVQIDVQYPADKPLPSDLDLNPVNLVQNASGVWMSENSYVMTPVEGNYSVLVTGTALSGDRTQKKDLFTLSQDFEAKLVDFLKLNVTLTGAEFQPNGMAFMPCNTIENGIETNLPLEISASLVNQKGELVLPEQVLVAANLDQALSITITDEAQTPLVSSAFLDWDPKGTFDITVLNDQTIPYACEAINIQISLNAGYDTTRYYIDLEQSSFMLRRGKGQGVNILVTTPTPQQNFPLHATFRDACKSVQAAQPVTVEFQLYDLNGNLLSPAAIANSDPSRLYTVSLIAPGGESSSSLELQVSADKIVATGGANLLVPGEYAIEIMPVPQEFMEGFVPSTVAPTRLSIFRQDGFWTAPSTCNTFKIIGWILLALLVLGAIFAFTGGPGGFLEFTESGKSDTVIKALRLSTARILSQIKGKKLSELGIQKLTYKRGSKDSEGHGTIFVQIYDMEGSIIFDSQLLHEEPVPLTSDYDIVYRKP